MWPAIETRAGLKNGYFYQSESVAEIEAKSNTMVHIYVSRTADPGNISGILCRFMQIGDTKLTRAVRRVHDV